MKQKLRNPAIIFIFIPFLVICITLYIYISHMSFVQIVDINNWKAFREMLAHISPWHYLLALLRGLVGMALFSLSCISLGLFVMGKLLKIQLADPEVGVTAFLVGEILYSLLMLTVISLYRLTPIFVAGSLLAGFLIGLPLFRKYTAGFSLRPRLPADFKPYEQIILFLLLISMLFGLFLVFTRLSYDATAEYFSHAKIMAESQSPTFFYPSDLFVVSTFHPGILFTMNIQLFGDQAARMLSWINGIVILLMGLLIGKKLGLDRHAQLWFLALMVTSTAYVDLLGDGKIEIISTAPILAAIYWALRSVEQPNRGTFLLIGFLAGFAIISRPYNIFLVSLFMALFFASQVFIQYRSRQSSLKKQILPLLWIIPPLMVLGVFHLFQNWIWLKSPIAPLIYAQQLNDTDWQWVVNPAYLPLYRLFYPFTLTFLNVQQSMGNISPLLIGSLPFLFIKEVRNNLRLTILSSRILFITIFILLTWITISFAVFEVRYVLFLWVLLFLAASKLLNNAIQHTDIPLIRPLIIAFLSIMCMRTFMIAAITYFPLDRTVQLYCPDNNLCKLMDLINKNANPGDRVFVLHAYRYYLRPDLFACSSRVDDYPALEGMARQNSSDFWVELYRRGYRFILFEEHLSEFRYHFGKLPSPTLAPDWMNIQLLYSNQGGTQRIYKIESYDAPIQPEIACSQNSRGVWELIH